MFYFCTIKFHSLSSKSIAKGSIPCASLFCWRAQLDPRWAQTQHHHLHQDPDHAPDLGQDQENPGIN